MKISIIVPVYNVQNYLERCLNSIINQTYSNLEIILVDDGSTDESGIICDKYLELDNRIKVIHKKNGGLGSARNVGIDNSTGDYLGFVDSDDWIDLNMYKFLIEICLKYHADIASMKYELVKKQDEFIQADDNCVKVYEQNRLEFYLSSMFDSKKLEQMVCNKLYKKELFIDLRFPEKQLYEDMFTNFLLIEKSNKWVVSNKIGYFYYQKGESITRSSFTNKNLDLLKVSHQIIDKTSSYGDARLYKNAISLKQKSILSLLIRIAKTNYKNKNLIWKLRLDLKKDINLIKQSKISKIEKTLIYIACINYSAFKFIVNLSYNLYKKI